MTVVRDIMHSGVLSVSEELPLLDLASFLIRHAISGAPVVDAEGRPVGVVSMSDLVAHAAGLDRPTEGHYLLDLWMEQSHQVSDLKFEADVLTRDVMTTFVVGVDEDSSLSELIDLVCRVKLHRILVTREGKLTGIVSTVDLVSHLGRLLRDQESPHRGDGAASSRAEQGGQQESSLVRK